jgi:hypothetical protein
MKALGGKTGHLDSVPGDSLTGKMKKQPNKEG